MRRRMIALLLSVAVCLFVVAGGLLWLEPDTSSMDVSIPTANRTELAVTRGFVSTAIAQFTAQPEFVASVTPYYGDLLWNQAMYINFTQTPEFDERDCWLYPDTRPLRALEADIVASLQSISGSAYAQAFANAVWNSKECDTYIVIRNWIQVTVETESIVSERDLATFVRPILEAITAAISTETDISSEARNVAIGIWIVMSETDRLRYQTTLDAILD